ncbi:MAG TPA: OmpH family outer membrane protein [Methylomirabilota bacterium]|nr:OmpH family outer membrane protein [Methylomirabilota bacterium]
MGQMRLVGILAMVAAGVVGGVWLGAPVTSAQTAPALKVAFVDLDRVVARSAAGVAARDQLQKEMGAMQKKIDAEQAALAQMRDELEKKGQLLSPEARRDKQDQLEKKFRDTRRMVDDMEKELQKKDRELQGKFLRDIVTIVQKVGKERGYAMIVSLRQGGVIYGAPEADLTDEVTRIFDDETKKAKK